MLKRFLLLAALCLAFGGEVFAKGSVSVRGYTRKDGTYVRPHTRSAPGSNSSSSSSTYTPIYTPPATPEKTPRTDEVLTIQLKNCVGVMRPEEVWIFLDDAEVREARLLLAQPLRTTEQRERLSHLAQECSRRRTRYLELFNKTDRKAVENIELRILTQAFETNKAMLAKENPMAQLTALSAASLVPGVAASTPASDGVEVIDSDTALERIIEQNKRIIELLEKLTEKK